MTVDIPSTSSNFSIFRISSGLLGTRANLYATFNILGGLDPRV